MMKNLFSILAAVIFIASAWAQAPQLMSYQAVIRDASNNLVTNHTVGMRVSIIVHWGPTPHILYQETYSPNPQTNANGLVTLAIGSGTPVTGTFSGINWTLGSYSIQTETDPTGGTNYTITGTSALLSVPFAISAQKADSANYSKYANKADSVNYSNIIGLPAPTHGSQYFDSSKTFTVPAGITTVWVTASGGGGGGGGGGDVSPWGPGTNGGNGGSGIFVIGYQITVVPGNSYTITVGAGGAGGARGARDNNGGNGGNSSFGSLLTFAGGGGGGGGNWEGQTNNGSPGSGNAFPLFIRGAGGTGGIGSDNGAGLAGASGASGFVLVVW